MIIGSHVSLNGSDQFLGSVQEALSYQANAFMVYTGAPQNSIRKPLELMKIPEGKQLMGNKILPDHVIVHAPYIVNLANPEQKNREFAIEFLIEEVKRTHAMGSKIIVLHPGAHLQQGVDKGIELVSIGINTIIEATHDTNVAIALETMAGKGTEIGRSFEELQQIIAYVSHKNRVGVCFDTCHTHDAGYDIINHFDDVLQEFDRVIGIDKLLVIHVNDSKNDFESHKDRHANIGFGNIGFAAIDAIVHHEAFLLIPKILETPYVQSVKNPKLSYPPYKQEIAMLKSRIFNENLITDILNEHEGETK